MGLTATGTAGGKGGGTRLVDCLSCLSVRREAKMQGRRCRVRCCAEEEEEEEEERSCRRLLCWRILKLWELPDWASFRFWPPNIFFFPFFLFFSLQATTTTATMATGRQRRELELEDGCEKKKLDAR